MSVIQTLFYHLIDPWIIIMALISGYFISGIKMRFIVAFTIGLIIELYFVTQHDGQEVSLFTLLLGTVAAYMWLVVASRIKQAFLKFKKP